MRDVANQVAPENPIELPGQGTDDVTRSRSPASSAGTDPTLLVPDRWLDLRLPAAPGAAPAETGRPPASAASQGMPGGTNVVTSTRMLLLATDEPGAAALRADLERAGLLLIGQAGEAERGVALARTLRPDAIVADVRALAATDAAVLRTLRAERVAPLLMAGVGASAVGLELALACGSAALLPATDQPGELGAVVAVALASWRELGQVERELAKTRQRLQDRIVVEQAKGLLMQGQPALTEAEAYARLRSLSMSKRTTIGNLARAVLLAHEAQQAGDEPGAGGES